MATHTIKLPNLVTPYGGRLVNLASGSQSLVDHAHGLKSIRLTEPLVYDLEMLSIGAFSPLDRFMGKKNFESACKYMRLQNGFLYPMPIVLPIDDGISIKKGEQITLRNPNNRALAIMNVEEIYNIDKNLIAKYVLGTNDTRHPYLSEVNGWGKRAISGEIQVLGHTNSHDFPHLRKTPAELRKILTKFGNPNVVAFQTRNPLHRAHEELTKMAASRANATLLIHPVVGTTKPGDVDRFTRVRIYEILLNKYYADHSAVLSILPLAMRMAGPREALWHMTIRRNYGANHMIIGRDHAGPGKNSLGEDFYDPYAAQKLAIKHAKEVGVKVLSFNELQYVVNEDRYEEIDKIKKEDRVKSISGTQVREKYLKTGKKLPKWFTRPEVAKILAEVYKPMDKRGFCLWMTGLSGSGKSTLADAIHDIIREYGRTVTILDGDVIRTNLSKGLGFSKEDRDINIKRIGFVAAEIVKHGGCVIVAAISPYKNIRNEVRNMVGDGFFEIYIDTPLKVCEERDIKGLYKMAREGKIENFTGINDPYEEPENPEFHIETQKEDFKNSVDKIITELVNEGYLKRKT